MANVRPFNYDGNWYKGNLHCHSTISDGVLTPEEVKKVYKSNNYNFLAFTEHNIFTYWKEFEEDNFIIIQEPKQILTKLAKIE